MALQTENINGQICVTDTLSPGVPYTGLAQLGGVVVASAAKTLSDRHLGSGYLQLINSGIVKDNNNGSIIISNTLGDIISFNTTGSVSQYPLTINNIVLSGNRIQSTIDLYIGITGSHYLSMAGNAVSFYKDLLPISPFVYSLGSDTYPFKSATFSSGITIGDMVISTGLISLPAITSTGNFSASNISTTGNISGNIYGNFVSSTGSVSGLTATGITTNTIRFPGTNVTSTLSGGGYGDTISANFGFMAKGIQSLTQGFMCRAGGYYYLGSNGIIAWASVGDGNGTKDLSLYREYAGTLSQYNSTNPQRNLLYNTRTSASVFERLNFGWYNNTGCISTEAAGGGFPRNLLLTSNLDLYLNSSGSTYIQSTGLSFVNIPTSNPGTTGMIWNDAGTLRTSEYVSTPSSGSNSSFNSTEIEALILLGI